jgi:PhnB protein
MAVSTTSKGYHSVTPYLVVSDPRKQLEFLKKTFDAVELEKMETNGSIFHASVKIGDSIVMMGQPMKPEMKPLQSDNYVYVKDCDETFKKALAAGAKPLNEPQDMFYGDRCGGVVDPLGNYWGIATHVEDVAPDEMKRRFQEMSRNMASAKK